MLGITCTVILAFKATNLILTTDAALEFGPDDYLLQKDIKYNYKFDNL